jgi:hypothetical protein
VVEVSVAHEEVAHSLRRDAGCLELPEHDGAAEGVEEHRLAALERDSEARLRSLVVEGVAGAEKITRPMPHPSRYSGMFFGS